MYICTHEQLVDEMPDLSDDDEDEITDIERKRLRKIWSSASENDMVCQKKSHLFSDK